MSCHVQFKKKLETAICCLFLWFRFGNGRLLHRRLVKTSVSFSIEGMVSKHDAWLKINQIPQKLPKPKFPIVKLWLRTQTTYMCIRVFCFIPGLFQHRMFLLESFYLSAMNSRVKKTSRNPTFQSIRLEPIFFVLLLRCVADGSTPELLQKIKKRERTSSYFDWISLELSRALESCISRSASLSPKSFCAAFKFFNSLK